MSDTEDGVVYRQIGPKDRFGRPIGKQKTVASPEQGGSDEFYAPNISSGNQDKANEITIGGKTYKFSDVTDPQGDVEGYTAQGATGAVGFDKADDKYLHDLSLGNTPLVDEKNGVGKIGDPHQLTDKEYDALTKEASTGNKLAQEILVKGHYKAQNAPSLQQDLNKVEDPFVKALGNLPNVASAGEAQVGAVTQPYDFSNAESQVNNILTNQGYAANAQPSAGTSAYINKIDSEAAGNPLTQSTLGLPSISSALSGLGPAAKLSEKAAPNSALLSALLSHIQYQDVYGTGLNAGSASSNPAWLQELLASVTGTTAAGGLPSPALAATGIGTVPGASSDTVPNTG
jgi:hypothetical protein